MAIALLAAMTISLRNLSWALAIFFCAYAGNAAAGQLDLIVNGRSYHVNSNKIRHELGFAPAHTIEQAISDLRDAFQAGEVPDPMNDPLYYNIKRMQELHLQ